jgi:TolA-binding protein
MAIILAGCFGLGAVAAAQQAKQSKPPKKHTPTTSERLQQMQEAIEAQQQQINQLTQQLKDRDGSVQQLQQQVTQAQSTATQAQQHSDAVAAQNTQQQQDVTAVKSDVADLKQNTTNTALSLQETQKSVQEMESPLAIHFKGVTLTPGGFLAAETVYRTRALAADINTPFNSVTFPGAGQSSTSEFFASGRQSRISLLAEGKISSAKLSGYYEADFLSAGVTSNNNQSNSYTLRQRQLWAQAALNSGWTFTGGQMWSLVTETKKGVDNRSEALPMTIDAQYTAGFSWDRQYGFRVSKKLGDNFWAAFSVENPQTTFAAHGANANFFLGSPGSGGGLYNSAITNCTTTVTSPTNPAPLTTCTPAASYSFNKAPDLIFKGVAEAGPGHFEVFGVLAQFRDRVYPCETTTGPCLGTTGPSAAGAYNDSRTGGGVGANARVSLVHKQLDLGIHFLGGDGIGRYGTVGLPDATVRPDGTLALIRSYQALSTVELHSKKADIYFNYGGEYADRAWYVNPFSQPTTGAPLGYGSPLFKNTGCSTETLPGAGGFAPGGLSSCTGDTRVLLEGTVGFWYRLYNGPKGRVQFGPQYSYIERNAWSGIGGAPKATENMVLTSFRYYLP